MAKNPVVRRRRRRKPPATPSIKQPTISKSPVVPFPIEKVPTKQKTIKFSIRLFKDDTQVTSIALRKDIIVLWFLFSNKFLKEMYEIEDIENIDEKNELFTKTFTDSKDALFNFIYTSLEYWNKPDAKGLSEFITAKLIADFLDNDDYEKFNLLNSVQF